MRRDAANKLNVRIINQTGHKLPTGYPEGRRIWINVKFFDENDDEILSSESGRYNEAGAYLEDTENTKIYEMKAGLSEEVLVTLSHSLASFESPKTI